MNRDDEEQARRFNTVFSKYAIRVRHPSPYYEVVHGYVQNLFPDTGNTLGPWGKTLADRLVLSRTFDQAPDVSEMHAAMAAYSAATVIWLARDDPDEDWYFLDNARTTSRVPICLLLAMQMSPRPIELLPGMVPSHVPGSWATPNLESGGVLLLDLHALPDQPGMGFLRWMRTPSSPEDAADRLSSFFSDELLTVAARLRIYDGLMAGTLDEDIAPERVHEIAVASGLVDGSN